MARLFSTLAVYGIVMALIVLGSGQASAHSAAPLQTLRERIGPYLVLVHYYSDPRGGQDLVFAIEPQAGGAAPATYHVVAIPGATTNATAINATILPAVDHAGIDGTVTLPVSGQWLLEIQVDGPLGSSYNEVPLLASAPPAIPEWLGWLVGAAPVATLFGFLLMQLRRARSGKPLIST